MMILFRQMNLCSLSQRNLISANIFVSASSWSQYKSVLSLLWLVARSAAPSRFAKQMFWQEIKTYGNNSLHFVENVFHQVAFIVRILKVTLKWLLKFSVINNFNFLYISWVFCPEFSFTTFYWKFKIMSIRNYNQHFAFKKAWEGFSRKQKFHQLHLKIFRSCSNQ